MGKENFSLLICSFCAVFSALQEQILTVPSRGGKQAQDICYSASWRRGRDFDTGCQDNLTRQASCFIGALRKWAAVALARVFCTSFCLLLDCWVLSRWHWNRMSWKPDERGERRKDREKEESDPWPLWPCDVSGAGRGRNWEWHSWLELPNCHFLSSLFTHSRSLSWTFEELGTDMCLLVQPSLGIVIIVAHKHSVKPTVRLFYMPNEDGKIEKYKREQDMRLRVFISCNWRKNEAVFIIVVPSVQLFTPSHYFHWI